MEKRQLTTTIQVYRTEEDLPPSYQRVLRAAKENLAKAYAPYSRFRVSAVALLEDGTLVEGANQENAAYPMCLCAERVALGNAAMLHPGQRIDLMAITIQNEQKVIDRPAAPCGSCRQAICEMEQRQGHPIKLLLHGETGEVWEVRAGTDLLPLGFSGDFL